MTETGDMNLIHHDHPQAEMTAPAWDLERLRAHMADMHDYAPSATDLQAMAAIHTAEHPVQAGIENN